MNENYTECLTTLGMPEGTRLAIFRDFDKSPVFYNVASKYNSDTISKWQQVNKEGAVHEYNFKAMQAIFQ